MWSSMAAARAPSTTSSSLALGLPYLAPPLTCQHAALGSTTLIGSTSARICPLGTAPPVPGPVYPVPTRPGNASLSGRTSLHDISGSAACQYNTIRQCITIRQNLASQPSRHTLGGSSSTASPVRRTSLASPVSSCNSAPHDGLPKMLTMQGRQPFPCVDAISLRNSQNPLVSFGWAVALKLRGGMPARRHVSGKRIEAKVQKGKMKRREKKGRD